MPPHPVLWRCCAPVAAIYGHRCALAKDNELPREVLLKVSKTYVELAEKITGKPLPVPTNAFAEIVDLMRDEFGLVD